MEPLQPELQLPRTSWENSLEDSIQVVTGHANSTVEDVTNHSKIVCEIHCRYGISPYYELLRVEGTCNEPLFTYGAWIGDKVGASDFIGNEIFGPSVWCITPVDDIVDIENVRATGVGKTKREAMHSAARTMVIKLCRASETDDSTNVNDSNCIVHQDAIFNVTRQLEKLCTARHWPPPRYDDVTFPLHPPHPLHTLDNLPFKVSCVVAKYCEIAEGKSEEIGKRLAAHKVWKIIQNDFEDDGFFDISPERINHIYSIQYLQKIAAANQIHVKYSHLAKRDTDDYFQCYAQLSPEPIVGSSGLGESKFKRTYKTQYFVRVQK